MYFFIFSHDDTTSIITGSLTNIKLYIFLRLSLYCLIPAIISGFSKNFRNTKFPLIVFNLQFLTSKISNSLISSLPNTHFYLLDINTTDSTCAVGGNISIKKPLHLPQKAKIKNTATAIITKSMIPSATKPILCPETASL